MRSIPLLAALTSVLATAAFAQDQRFDLVVTDSDRPYGTPGYTFRVIPITVTDAEAFRVDAVQTIGTIDQVEIVDFIIFVEGQTVPEGAGVDYSSQAEGPDSVAYFFDNLPQEQNPTPLTSGQAGPLTTGNFQLVVAPYDFEGTGGDYTVTLELYGVTSPIAPVGPANAAELAALLNASGTSARLLVIGADGVARDMGQVSIATRGNRISFARVTNGPRAGSVVLSTNSAPGMMGEVFAWAEATGFRSTSYGRDDGTLEGSGLQIGADIPAGPDMVAGMSVGYTTINAEDAGFISEGSYRYAQPYLSYRSGDWHGTASLLLGRGSFEQSSAGGVGEADVTLTALAMEGGRDIPLAEGYTITPTLGLLHGREEVEGTSGTLTGTTGDVRFTQASVGARLTQRQGEGAVFAGLHADFLDQESATLLAQDMLSDDGWTGRLELGMEAEQQNGMMLSTGFELRGLGGDMRTLSGALQVALEF